MTSKTPIEKTNQAIEFSATCLEISIVIPAYNEQDNIAEMYRRLISVIGSYTFEIIFIDDGSSDNTLQQIIQLSTEDSRVKYISFSRNFGHQSALKAGLDAAKGQCAISLDADLQHPPELIPKMLEQWRNGYEIVYTVRQSSAKISFLKKVASRCFYKIFKSLSGINIEQGAADFRLIDQSVLQVIRDNHESILFLRGMISWIGFKQFAISYEPQERFAGTTKYSVSKMFKLASAGITSFSILPLHLATLIGVFFSTLAGLYGLYAIAIQIFTDKAVTGWASVISSVLFIGGIQLLMLGILGEYIGMLFIETKKRPTYIIRKKNV